MSAQSRPVGMDISEVVQERINMAAHYMPRLQYFAHRAMCVKGIKNDQFIVVCIKVDTRFRDIVDILMPNTDWQQFRDRKEEPMALGWVPLSDAFQQIIITRLPELEACLLEPLRDGVANCIAIDEGGGIVIEITPVLST